MRLRREFLYALIVLVTALIFAPMLGMPVWRWLAAFAFYGALPYFLLRTIGFLLGAVVLRRQGRGGGGQR